MEGKTLLERDVSDLKPSDLDGSDLEPDRKVVEPGYDAEVYIGPRGTEYMVRDNPECVWEEGKDGNFYCVETGSEVRWFKHAEVGQNDMGDVITRSRPGCVAHEKSGPNSYTGSYDHRDVFDTGSDEKPGLTPVPPPPLEME